MLDINSFINKSFTNNECSQYVEDANNKNRCSCGDEISTHAESQNIDIKTWDTSLIKTIAPSNAYGKLKIITDVESSPNICSYVRLGEKDVMERVLDLLVDYWDVFPKGRDIVCVSFIGCTEEAAGEATYQMIENALLETAQTMDMVVISSGQDNAFSRDIGKMVQKVTRLLKITQKSSIAPRYLGILPWGSISDKNVLINNGETVTYDMDLKTSNDNRIFISPYLTHALLIDNGQKIKPNVLSCNEFRWRMETKIMSTKIARVTTILWNGSLGSITEAERRINRGISLVLLQNTAGAADLAVFTKSLWQTYEEFEDFKPEHMITIYEKMNMLKEDNDKEEAYEDLKRIFIDHKKVLIHDIHGKVKLITTICDGFSKSLFSAGDFFEFALKWNRVEKLEKIGTVYLSTIPTDRKNSLFVSALLKNRHTFIQCFNDIGVKLEEVVNLHMLHILYNNFVNESLLVNIWRKQSEVQTTHKQMRSSENSLLGQTNNNNPKTNIVYLSQVESSLKVALGNCNFDVYKNDSMTANNFSNLETISLNVPSLHLFIWAIFVDSHEMAISLLKISHYKTTLGVLGTALNEWMATLIPIYDTGTRAKFLQQAEYFRNLSTNLLTNINSLNNEIAIDLVVMKHQFLADRNCLELCHALNNTRFLSLFPCQNYIDRVWNKGIRTRLPVLVLTYICPILLLFGSLFQFNKHFEGNNTRERTNSSVLLQRIKNFYTSPKSKVFQDIIFHVALLILFSYVFLFDMTKNRPSIKELITIGYLCLSSVNFIFEILSAALIMKHNRIAQLILSSFWIMFNIFRYLVTWIYLALRLADFDSFNYLRILLGFILILCYLRSFELILMSPILGPYLVLMPKMIQKLAYFLLIFLIFMIAYGIGINVLMYPSMHNRTITDLFKLFEIPYYNLFGELYLDQVDGKMDNCGDSCPVANPITKVIHIIYIWFGMILLLNLLIAIFSDVFTKKCENAVEEWKFNRFHFSVMYSLKSPFPPPVSTVILIITFFIKLCKNISKEKQLIDDDKHVTKNHEICEQMFAIEDACFSEVILTIERWNANTIEANLNRTTHIFTEEFNSLSTEVNNCVRKWDCFLQEKEDKENTFDDTQKLDEEKEKTKLIQDMSKVRILNQDISNQLKAISEAL